MHTAQGSLLDSILKVPEAVKFAKDNGMKAMAITDHGSMSNIVNFVKECKKQGIKPIIGNEIYEVDDMTWKADTKDYKQPRYHMVLLARTQQGYKNLLKITSVSKTEGLYKKPRIDMKYIKDNNLGKGIICLTACQAGRLSRYLTDGRYKEAEQFIQDIKDIFDYVVCELQSHTTEAQAEANKLIFDFANEHNLPYTITTDAHMLSDSLIDSHAMFVEIGEGREVGESYVDCYLQKESEIYQKLSCQFPKAVIDRGLQESNNISSIIEDIDIGLNKGNIMPKVKIDGPYKNHEEYLRYLVFKTFKEKFGHMSKEDQDERKKRLETELPVLYAVDYTDYFIMLYMLAKEARRRKIPIGYSRGSGANCLCLFMLNVTQIDSVRWGLDFSRFANLGRKSMADFDWDISKRRRKEMVEISEELFGKENVAPICTFNSLSTKVAIRDIGKVLDEKVDSPYYKQIPYKLRDDVAKMIPTIKTLNDLGEEEEKDVLLKDILSKNPKLDEIYNKFPLWFKYVMDVEGLPKSMGRHAAGTLITPTPVTDYAPLCYDKERNIMIEFEMHNAMDDLGLIKMDYLGLETLDIIDDTLNMAGITWEDVDINHLNLSDKDVYDQVYKPGYTVGIFQMESAEARRMCIEAKADNIEDIIVVNAANRPGTKDSFPIYCQNKLHPESVQTIHDDLKTLFKTTQGVLLYQEEALQLFRYAGFPEEEVDNARRCVDENTLVLMGNGNYKKIKDIKPGDYVESYNPNKNIIEYKRVKNVFNNGQKETYKIITTHEYELNATGDHKVLTQNGWKNVSDLTCNDYIMTPKRIIAKDDGLRSNQRLSSTDMYLLGLLIGDGCIKDNQDIHFTNHEKILISEFEKCVTLRGKKEHILKEKCDFNYSIQDGVTVDKIYSVYIGTPYYKNLVVSMLNSLGVRKAAGEKHIPDCIMSYPKGKKILNLLAGLFNTDGGYVTNNRAIEYYSTSKILALQIKSLLEKYSIYSYVYSKYVPGYDYNCYTIMIRQNSSLQNFKQYILPLIIGEKHKQYNDVINSALSCKNTYDYLLPAYYQNEIIKASKNSQKSFISIGNKIDNGNTSALKISQDSEITDRKAREVINHLYCPKTYELLTADYIPVKIKEIKNNGIKNVFDIEVEDNHSYIADGLIVHNCIGKKLKDKMAGLEKDFRSGLKKKNWTENELSEIWQLMLKQSEYCFNRGHAVAYGLLSYLTAYLKVHYTVYFMAALLTSKSDKVEKISIVINDCKRLGIKVSPPNVNKSNKSFTAIAKNNEILFGLLAVKGLGDSIVDKIIELRPYKNLNDFIEKVQDKTAIITLIKAGGIPTKNKMSTLKKYADSTFVRKEYKPVTTTPSPYSKLIPFGLNVEDYRDGKKVNKEKLLNDYNEVKEKKFLEEQNIKYKKHMEDFQEKYAKDEYLWEFDTLSMFLTNDPLKDAYKYTKIDWDLVMDGDKTVLFCVIVDAKRKKDKNGNQFAYLDLYTPYGIIEATIWSSQLKEYSDYIKKGSCLAILGRKREEHFFVEKIKTYNMWLEQMRKKGAKV